MDSEAFSYNKADIEHILKVLAWTVASAIVAMLISIMGVVEFPTEMIWLVPVINTGLVALKKFIVDNR